MAFHDLFKFDVVSQLLLLFVIIG